jgi:hypothetical protein
MRGHKCSHLIAVRVTAAKTLVAETVEMPIGLREGTKETDEKPGGLRQTIPHPLEVLNFPVAASSHVTRWLRPQFEAP